jgi:hypothetical protein
MLSLRRFFSISSHALRKEISFVRKKFPFIQLIVHAMTAV